MEPEENDPTLKAVYSTSGKDVLRLQKILSELGLLKDVDGVFGADTKSAVEKFQRRNGLPADGVAGEETWNALNAAKLRDVEYELEDARHQDAQGRPTKEVIRELQRDLNSNLGADLATDGIVGQDTLSAVRDVISQDEEVSAMVNDPEAIRVNRDQILKYLTETFGTAPAQFLLTSLWSQGPFTIDAPILELQEKLKAAGALTGEVDGSFGQTTKSDIISLASEHGLLEEIERSSEFREFAHYVNMARRLGLNLDPKNNQIIGSLLFREAFDKNWRAGKPTRETVRELQELLDANDRLKGPLDGGLGWMTIGALYDWADDLIPTDQDRANREAVRGALSRQFPELSDPAIELFTLSVWHPGPEIFEQETAPFYSDRPAEVDELGRGSVARTIATIVDSVWREPVPEGAMDHSFMVHIHGPWGSGKTSILNFLKKDLLKGNVAAPKRIDGPSWIVVDYNAWQNQSLGPAWWSLMEAVYHATRAQLRKSDRRTSRKLLWGHRFWQFRTAWLPSISGALLLVVALFVLLFVDPSKFGLGDEWGAVAKTISGLAPLIGSIFLFRNNLWLFNSKAAERYVELARDPIRPLTRRFGEMISNVNRPVAVFIDDLDRCNPDFVVELLQSIQTLFRGARVLYVVAADRDWISTAYEKAYSEFNQKVSEPGKNLGHLFLEKVFQLAIEVPQLGDNQRDVFWSSLIKVDDAERSSDTGTPSQPGEHSKQDRRQELETQIDRRTKAATNEAELIDIVRQSTGSVEEASIAGAKVFERLQSPELRKKQEHLLWHYRSMLESNPRAMKRLLNAYGFRRGYEIWNYGTGRAFDQMAGRDVDDDQAIYDPDRIVRETILETRWPVLADYLDPHSTRRHDKDTINALLKNREVQDVVGPLNLQRFTPIE
ncbi:hypothetical protein RA28_03100 [Ruegeria sp. ANG-S4]|uniref:P-loop NTPase fold protein n=1 Tax=Ruegeria sp. ANG-S4 TaxID=1577904 RepID=UPI00057C6BEE|nr:P-loop NTPase fold protein [Ruegeria sp. ANG-S4]KIC46757.1 hypothetical protein RA28_03100 [Ruegeria sp. ANG-S4]